MRFRLAWALFGLGVFIAACGGGGKSGIVPGVGSGPGGNNAPTNAKTRHASISLYVPPPAKQANSRKPFYISSNTQAFGVVVIPYPSTIPSPLPTTNLQLFPVTTPSPCAAAGGGGETCNLTVTAPVGTDLFIVAAFATAAPSGNTTPLSMDVSGPVTVSLSPSPDATPISFTLNGVVYSVNVNVASPDPGNTPNTQVFTVGVPTSAPVTIVANDATGAQVMSDPTAPYFAPIVIQASPAGEGLTLSLTSTSSCGSGIQNSGATATIACAGDLNSLQVNYNGEATPDPNDHLVDAFVVAATAQPNPTPSPANFVLASNMLAYQLATNLGYIYNAYLQRTSSGQFVYIAEGSTWNIGTFSPSTATAGALSQLTTASDIISVAQGPGGAIWVDDNGPIDCYNSSGGAAVVSGIYPVVAGNGDAIYPVAITIDSANNLWYVGYDNVSTPQMYAGYFNVSTGCANPNPNPPVEQFTLSGDTADYWASLTSLPGGGAAMATSYYYGFGVYTMTTSSPSTISIVPPALGSAEGYGIAADAAGTVYAGFSSGTSDVETLASGASSLNTLLDLAPVPAGSGVPNPEPSGLNVFSPSGGAADRAEYTDRDYSALGLIESVPASPMPILVSLPNSADPFQAAYSTKGGEYILDMDANENLNIVRVMPTTTWSVPNLALNSACGSTALLTILERGDSGPFTLTFPGNAGTVTATQLPGADHDFYLSVPGTAASFTAMVTDAHGRSESFNVTSTPSTVTCGLAHRRLKTHPR